MSGYSDSVIEQRGRARLPFIRKLFIPSIVVEKDPVFAWHARCASGNCYLGFGFVRLEGRSQNRSGETCSTPKPVDELKDHLCKNRRYVI